MSCYTSSYGGDVYHDINGCLCESVVSRDSSAACGDYGRDRQLPDPHGPDETVFGPPQ